MPSTPCSCEHICFSLHLVHGREYRGLPASLPSRAPGRLSSSSRLGLASEPPPHTHTHWPRALPWASGGSAAFSSRPPLSEACVRRRRQILSTRPQLPNRTRLRLGARRRPAHRLSRRELRDRSGGRSARRPPSSRRPDFLTIRTHHRQLPPTSISAVILSAISCLSPAPRRRLWPAR
jgi:hypothetical protein